MPGQNKYPMIGWHPPGELGAWIRAEAGRRGMSISAFLTEVLADARARVARSEGEK